MKKSRKQKSRPRSGGREKIIEKWQLISFFCEDNEKNDCDSQQRSENIDVDHRIVNRIHNYSLIKNKSIDQKIKDNTKPEIITDQFRVFPKNGPINTEAKNTCPTSRIISDNFSGLDSVIIYHNYIIPEKTVNFVYEEEKNSRRALKTQNPRL